MKYLIVLLINIGSFTFALKNDGLKEYSISPEQKEAFAILTQKCNICHTDQNPSKVFTIENMNGFAGKINRQVFVWKRMPKGKEVKLSEIEKKRLKTWINRQLKK